MKRAGKKEKKKKETVIFDFSTAWKRVASRDGTDLQAHDDLSKAIPKTARAHQRRKLHALGLGIECVSHARTEWRWDGKIRVVPAQKSGG